MPHLCSLKCLIFAGCFLQQGPIISGCFAEETCNTLQHTATNYNTLFCRWNLQLTASYGWVFATLYDTVLYDTTHSGVTHMSRSDVWHVTHAHVSHVTHAHVSRDTWNVHMCVTQNIQICVCMCKYIVYGCLHICIHIWSDVGVSIYMRHIEIYTHMYIHI